jgi:hypothetical protein
MYINNYMVYASDLSSCLYLIHELIKSIEGVGMKVTISLKSGTAAEVIDPKGLPVLY